MGQGSNPVVCVYLRKVDVAGAPVDDANFFEMGEVPDLNFSKPKEITSYKGNTCETDGLTVDTLVTEGDAEGVLGTFSVNSKIVGLMYGVDPVEVVNPGSTLTASPVTRAWKYGDWVEIGVENLDDDIIIQDDTDLITYDKPADYKLNPHLGMIKFISGGLPVVEGSEFHVSGTELAKTFQRINIKKGDVGFYELRAVAKNRIGGNYVKDHLLCCRVVATSSRVIGVSQDSTDRVLVEFQFIPQIPVGGDSYGEIDNLPKMVGS